MLPVKGKVPGQNYSHSLLTEGLQVKLIESKIEVQGGTQPDRHPHTLGLLESSHPSPEIAEEVDLY